MRNAKTGKNEMMHKDLINIEYCKKNWWIFHHFFHNFMGVHKFKIQFHEKSEHRKMKWSGLNKYCKVFSNFRHFFTISQMQFNFHSCISLCNSLLCNHYKYLLCIYFFQISPPQLNVDNWYRLSSSLNFLSA